jgi:hypothetical protein
MKLSEYVWRRGPVESQTATWSDVEAAIRRLDGETYSSVMLERDSMHWIGIAGGNDGRYFVSTWDDETNGGYVALSNPDTTGTIDVVIGGQAVDRPARWIVTQDEAVSAARAYFESGRLSPALKWEADQ